MLHLERESRIITIPSDELFIRFESTRHDETTWGYRFSILPIYGEDSPQDTFKLMKPREDDGDEEGKEAKEVRAIPGGRGVA
jgi:hypothetical protein